MTDRDDFSLPSTVGTSASGVGGPVIKIVLGGDAGQVRRVPAHRIVKNGKPAYGLLRTLIARYAFSDKKAPARGCDVTTTYTDDDGDTITISTDEELEDALAVVVADAGDGKKHVLRINAIAKERADKKKVETDKPNDDAPTEAEAVKPRHAPSERELACGSAGKLQWDLLAVEEGKLDPEAKDAADRIVKNIVNSITLESEAAPAKAESEGDDKKDQETDAAESKPKAESVVFIHARHTCDGCGVTPIMGTRYHATEHPDFDLCQGCFFDPSVGASDHKNFVIEELDRDRGMQHRWARRHARGQFRCGRGRRCHGPLRQHRRQMRAGCPVAPAQKDFAQEMKNAAENKQDDSDKELQEAVLRSMQAFKDEIAEDKTVDKEEDELKSKPTPSAEEDGKAEKDTEEAESKPFPSFEEDIAASWRGVAESFSSANAESGDFADVLGAVASAVASEMEKTADVVADATRSAGSTAAESTRSASAGPVPNGIAAAIAAAMNASRVASTVAKEVKTVIDKELQKKTEDNADSVPDIPAGAMDEEEIIIEPDVEAPKDVEEEEELVANPEDKAHEDIEEEEEMVKDAFSKEGEDLKKDDESEKSEWEDVGAEDKQAVVGASDADSLGSSSTGIAPPVLARWAEQLALLRQLGFTDDRKSVDALETLQAANLGVDSTDEVTVGDAVNYLLKKAEE